MEDDKDASEEERIIELTSIEAIFPEMKIDPEDAFTAVLDIPVEPERPLKIYFQTSTKVATRDVASLPPSNAVVSISSAAANVDIHELSYLPPLTLRISLPEGYPATQPPQVDLSSNPRWVPNSVLKSLGEDCKRLWTEIGQDQIVYTFIDHIQQSAETAFGIGADTGGRFELPGDLKISLLDFDLRKRKEHFEKETFDCGICLEPKKGLQCHRLLLCGHVFCIACLQDFYNNAISEGDIDAVKCLAPGCGKEEAGATPDQKRRRHDRTLNPSELLQIPIEAEKVQRYVHMKRKKKLEADQNIIYCPRQWCQGAAKSKKHPKPTDLFGDFEETDSEPEEDKPVVVSTKKKRKDEEIPMSERLAVCEDCDFAFCSVCKKGWHGELVFCNPRRQAELDGEEQATLDYLKQFSTPCPTCRAPAQKTMGCNHMICFQCKTHFCYLCSAYLMPENPYGHFNDFKSTCYMRLWELEGGDGADVGRGLAGNAVPWDPHDFDSDSDSETESESDEDEDEDEAGFAGDGIVFEEDGDDVVQPVPLAQAQQPRNLHIEIVNFAGNGANQRIQLPDPPEEPVPPPAPNPPAARRNGQHRNQRPANNAVNNRNAPRQGNNRRNQAVVRPVQEAEHRAPPPERGNALERFLQLAMNDQEDEWDSDELDEDELNDAAEPPVRNGRRVNARR